LLKNYVYTSDLSTPIVPAQHGDASGVRGAAMLWPA
jgi:fructokinase